MRKEGTPLRQIAEELGTEVSVLKRWLAAGAKKKEE
jgi:hypothetical protein